MKALAPVRTVGPSAPIIDLADAKAHLRVLANDDDALIEALISAAEAHLDGFSGILGRALVTQTWQRSFGCFPSCDTIRLPLGPLIGSVAVTYYDSANAQQSFTDFTAVSDAVGPKVVLGAAASWPGTFDRPDAITITWQCGYGDAADVPAPIIHAAKLLIGHWFASREATAPSSLSELPLAVSALLAPYRAVGV